MAQNKDFQNFFSPEFSKTLFSQQGFPFDMKSFMDTQRKNFQAITEAQQLAAEAAQTVAQRGAEIASQILEDQSALTKEMLSEGTPEDKAAKQTDIMKKTYDKSITNMKELSEIMSKSSQEASEIINKRMSASFTEIKSSIKSAAKEAA